MKFLVFLLALTITITAADALVTQWEYKVISQADIGKAWDKAKEEKGITHARGSFQKYLDQLGAQGWELVCVNPAKAYIFKRPKKLTRTKQGSKEQ